MKSQSVDFAKGDARLLRSKGPPQHRTMRVAYCVGHLANDDNCISVAVPFLLDQLCIYDPARKPQTRNHHGDYRYLGNSPTP